MPQMNPKTVDSALATLISADPEHDAIKSSRAEDLALTKSKFNNAQKLARRTYDSSGETTANTLAIQEKEARAAAERLAGQGIPGFEEECARRGVNAGEFSGGTPRQMSDFGQDIDYLDRTWKQFDELNAVEAAMNAESKPWMSFVWLGVLVAGFLALFVMSIVLV